MVFCVFFIYLLSFSLSRILKRSAELSSRQIAGFLLSLTRTNLSALMTNCLIRVCGFIIWAVIFRKGQLGSYRFLFCGLDSCHGARSCEPPRKKNPQPSLHAYSVHSNVIMYVVN